MTRKWIIAGICVVLFGVATAFTWMVIRDQKAWIKAHQPAPPIGKIIVDSSPDVDPPADSVQLAKRFLYVAASCLVVDQVRPITPKCGHGVPCSISGNTDDLMAAVVPHYEVTGHNSCEFQSIPAIVTVAFYDIKDFRLGVNSVAVDVLIPGERFRAMREVPPYVRVAGAVSKVAVKDIRNASENLKQ